MGINFWTISVLTFGSFDSKACQKPGLGSFYFIYFIDFNASGDIISSVLIEKLTTLIRYQYEVSRYGYDSVSVPIRYRYDLVKYAYVNNHCKPYTCLLSKQIDRSKGFSTISI